MRARAREGFAAAPPKKGDFMDKRETKMLFRFLGQIYPNAAKFSQDTAMLAWQLVLEPFAYDDIKISAAKWARENKYPPDPQELCRGLLPQKIDEKKDAAARPLSVGEQVQQYIEARGLDGGDDDGFSVSKYAREHGLTWAEAAEEAERLGLYRRP